MNEDDMIGHKWYTTAFEAGHTVSGQWFDSPCYRVSVHWVNAGTERIMSKTLRMWPKTEDDAKQEISRMMLWDNEDIRRRAESRYSKA